MELWGASNVPVVNERSRIMELRVEMDRDVAVLVRLMVDEDMLVVKTVTEEDTAGALLEMVCVVDVGLTSGTA